MTCERMTVAESIEHFYEYLYGQKQKAEVFLKSGPCCFKIVVTL